MRLVSLSCNHCGAPLEAPRKARFVTCAFCNSRLAVHFTDTTAYTEVLEALDERTERIAEDVDVIRIQNEIERLDREWMMSRERYMVRGKDGEMSVPSTTGSIIGGIICTVFAIFWISMASSIGAPGLFPLFGVLFLVFGLVVAVRGATSASSYETSRRSYEANRDSLMRELRDRSKPA